MYTTYGLQESDGGAIAEYQRKRGGLNGLCAVRTELTKALGKEVHYNAVSPEAYRKFGFPGADDLGNMFQFKRDFNQYFCGARNVQLSRMLNPELQNFETWLARNKDRIPLE